MSTTRKVSEIVQQITIAGSILKETECEAVIKRFFQILAENLQQGIGFESEFLILSQSISGVFASETEAFDPTRHQVTLTAKAGTEFQKALTNVAVVRVDHSQPKPFIKKVFDTKSRTPDSLTPGYMLDLQGHLLKIEDETDPAQGVFLISTKTEEEVRVAYIHHNGIKRLQVEIPDNLSTGDRYRLQVRSTIQKSKEVRTGMYEKVFTIA